MRNVFLIAGALLVGAAGGYWMGLQAKLPFPISGLLPAIRSTPEQWRKDLPPLMLEARGTIHPQNGQLGVDATLKSMDSSNSLTADIRVEGTLEKPRWTLRSLKKKNVRLEIRL